MTRLLPNKNSDPSLTIINVAGLLIKEIKNKKVISLSDLKFTLEKRNKKAIYLFEMALSFIFITGLISYHAHNDIIEYIGP